MGKNDFKRFSTEARKVIKDLPRDMGKALLLETSDNFRRQGYEDEEGHVHQWAPRKGRRGRLGPPAGRQRAILVQSGRLRRSPRNVAMTSNSVTVGTDVPYAQPLQEGADPHLPARPFIVVSKSLREKIARNLTAKIKAALR